MGARMSKKYLGSVLLWATAISSTTVPLAYAGDLTISDARTTPVDTLTGDGEGPGTIIIDSSGSVQTGSLAAVTLNSNHSVTNSGNISNQGVGIAGILVDLTAIDPDTGVSSARDVSGTVSNVSTLSVSNPLSSADPNLPILNAGIRVSGLGTFTGDIVNGLDADTTGGRIITDDGARSYGIAVEGTMIGNVINDGLIQVDGKSAFGIMTTGHITGSIESGGNIFARNHQGSGVYIGGGLDGTYTHTGVITTGLGSQLVSEDGFNLTRLPAILGRNGVWIASDVTGGVLLQGNGFTIAEESESVDAATALPLDSTITIIGGGPAIFITPGGPSNSVNDITIGPRDGESGFGFVNRGRVIISGAQGGASAMGFDIEGVQSGGVTYTSTLQGGLWNDGGDFRVSALDAEATGLRIGAFGHVDAIRNDGSISVFTADSTSRLIDDFVGELGGNGYGVIIEESGFLGSFENSGTLLVDVSGPTSSAFGVIDRSGTLASFTNTGTINMINPDGSSGQTLAVDMSANTSGATFYNSGTIIGDVRLGSGNQTATFEDGTISGNLTFQAGAGTSGNTTLVMDGGSVSGQTSIGNGNHVISLSNGADLSGGVVATGGTIDLTVDGSEIAFLSTNPVTATGASFVSGSTVTFDIAGGGQAPGEALMEATGQVTFDADSRLTATVSGIIDDTETYSVIRAGNLSLGTSLEELVSTPTSYMNNIAFSIDPNNSNAILLAVDRKSAEQLGLGPNYAAIYNSFATPLNSDKPVAAALSSLQNQTDFEQGLQQLLPDTSGATLQAAINNQDMGTGMIRRRMVAVAKSGLPNHAQGDVAGFWAQAIGNYAKQNAQPEQAGFSVWGLGIAIGADFPIFNDRAHIGVSLLESWQTANLKETANSPIEFYTTQLSIYGRHRSERFYTQAILTGAYNTYDGERRLDFGGLNRTAVASWDGFQWGGTLETGAIFNWDLYELVPYVRGAFVSVHEDGYTETGGGSGVDLAVGSKNAESFRSSIGFSLDRDFPIYYDSYMEAEFRANFTRDIINNPFTLTADFVAGDSPFVVTGPKRTPNRFNFGLGLAHKDSYSSVSIDYDTEIASGYIAHTAALTARFRF